MKRNLLVLAFKALINGPVTTKYPFKPSPAPEGFRGRPEYDPEKCTGCGACVEVCPSGSITRLESQGKRTVSLWYGKCTFCARCEEVCPEKAIKLTRDFELATFDKEHLTEKVEIEMVRCERCGNWLTTARIIDKVKAIPRELKLDAETLERTMMLCPKCRREVEASILLGLSEKKL